jgi:hypothetical protein
MLSRHTLGGIEVLNKIFIMGRLKTVIYIEYRRENGV